MKLPFQDLLKRLEAAKRFASYSPKNPFIKADKKFLIILGIVFVVSAIALFCYWFFMEKPYYERLLAEKDELIKSLKFTRDKQKKIYENSVDAYEQKLKSEYIPKSVYDDKINDYEQKLTAYQNDYVSKEEQKKQIKELEKKLREENHNKEILAKKETEQKIIALEQNVSLLQDKNTHLKASLEKSVEFIKAEKETLEGMLQLERKKAFIPSLILPETKISTLTSDVLKRLVTIKDKLKHIEEMNIALKPDTYFELGLISYYNKQYDEAVEEWENAVSLNKNNLMSYICLGILYNEQNMTDNAIKVLNRALEINPKYATLHLILARIFQQKGDLDNAIYEYSKTLEINPESIEIHKTLGTLYEKKGLKEEAKKSFALYEKLKAGKK